MVTNMMLTTSSTNATTTTSPHIINASGSDPTSWQATISDEKLSTVKVGQEVELLGPHITLEKASELSNLSQYEILTGVRERYQRIYIPID